jgi:alkylation response protein AidB-like acyl-CoA dehydrogenase
MTERTGGSDVATSEAIARQVGGGWRLYGTKWFTSAVTSEMALTLATPEGTTAHGGRGLALFYVETRGPNGTGVAEGLSVNRLKDKLGTRKLPTGELTLDGLAATPVTELGNGIKAITPMLTITRTWNAVCAASALRRGLALARDYGRRRHAFGAKLADKPLHQETVAGLQAESEGAFHLAFRAVELLGRDEANDISEQAGSLLRLITPLAKLCTGRQAMAVMPEVLEVFAGAGYLEDTGIARLERDAQVLPIWEGTTNVLSLDVLRALAKEPAASGAYLAEIERALAGTRAAQLAGPAKLARDAAAHAFGWVQATFKRKPELVEAGARGFAMTLARSLELALLVEQGQWSLDHEHDGRAAAAAARFARHGVDCLAEPDAGAAALADDRPLPA